MGKQLQCTVMLRGEIFLDSGIIDIFNFNIVFPHLFYSKNVSFQLKCFLKMQVIMFYTLTVLCSVIKTTMIET